MIFFANPKRSKRTRARDGKPLLASSAVRRQRRVSGLSGKATRRLKNAHRRHRHGVDKSNIHWTAKPTRKDLVRQRKSLTALAANRKRRRSWW